MKTTTSTIFIIYNRLIVTIQSQKQNSLNSLLNRTQYFDNQFRNKMDSKVNSKTRASLNIKTQAKIMKAQQRQLKENENSKICRICLGSQNKSQFIKPCLCSGSLQLVHNDCLVEWLNHVLIKNAKLGRQSQDIHCQICKQNLQIQYGKKLQCKDLNTVKQTIKLNKYIASVCIIFIVMSIWVLAALLYFYMNKNQILGIDVEGTTFIVVFTLISLHTLIWLGILGYCFFVRWQFYVKTVKQKQSSAKNGIQINNENIVMPIKNQKGENMSKFSQSKIKENILSTSTSTSLNMIRM